MLAEGGSLMGKALDVLYECLPPTVRIEEVRVASGRPGTASGCVVSGSRMPTRRFAVIGICANCNAR